jgi:hypothetical protein
LNLRPTDYESVALPLSYTGIQGKLAFSIPLALPPLGSEAPSPRRLDPAVAARLRRELQTPWRGLRRALWLALAASGGVGLAAMALRLASGQEVGSVDLLIQLAALVLFAGLLWFDRDRAGVAGRDAGGGDG